MCTHWNELFPPVLYKGCLTCAPILLWCVILTWNFSPEPEDLQTNTHVMGMGNLSIFFNSVDALGWISDSVFICRQKTTFLKHG